LVAGGKLPAIFLFWAENAQGSPVYAKMKAMKQKIMKLSGMLIGIGLAVWLVYRAFGRMLPGLIPVLKSGNEKAIEAYLSHAGNWEGMVCVFLLQFLQVVTIIFPGWPIQVAAGIIYGGLRAFGITLLAYWSANMVTFFVIRQMKDTVVGRNRAARGKEGGKEQLTPGKAGAVLEKNRLRLAKKHKESTFISRIKNTHPILAVMMGVLMPGMPNGFIPYVAAGTRLTYKQFAFAIAAGCWFPIFMTCMAGHFILTGDFLISIIMIVCPIVVVAFLYQHQYKILQYLDSRQEKLQKKEQQEEEHRDEAQQNEEQQEEEQQNKEDRDEEKQNEEQMERQWHGFGPVFDRDSRILILGSFPSVKSRAVQFYYGHPNNRFWKVLSEVLGEALPETTEEKRNMVLKHHIALWDVLESCEIEGSSDASIRGEEPVDIRVITDSCRIEKIFTNGAAAKKNYDRFLKDKTGREAICLPSTSPANAAWSLAKLTEKWNGELKNGIDFI
jgi:TDG/mug DNA glycosylase family protein